MNWSFTDLFYHIKKNWMIGLATGIAAGLASLTNAVNIYSGQFGWLIIKLFDGLPNRLIGGLLFGTFIGVFLAPLVGMYFGLIEMMGKNFSSTRLCCMAKSNLENDILFQI